MTPRALLQPDCSIYRTKGNVVYSLEAVPSLSAVWILRMPKEEKITIRLMDDEAFFGAGLDATPSLEGLATQ